MSLPPEVASFMAALDKTQHLAPDRLLLYQRRLLDKLVRHARAETDFYRDRLAPIFRSDDTIDWERWTDIPILTRQAAQENFEPMRARSLPRMAGGPFEDSSSGSTGRPLRHLQTDIQNFASACASERFFRWHGLRPEALTARIRAAVSPETAYPHGRPSAGWRIGHPESRVIDLSIATATEQQIEWLARIRPDYLISYPTNLRELARLADDRGGRLKYERVLTFGEMVTDDAGAAIKDHFGMEPLDRYGASEVGHISGTCPHFGRHHIAAELVSVEILDEAGNPAARGAVGRVVITPFYNLAMPFVRYELGDYAALAAEPCACGRTLPTFERILGRERNVFRFADGTSVWPVLLSKDLVRFVPYRQFQVVQTAPAEIEFRYIPKRAGQPIDLGGLTAYVRQRLHPSLAVTATEVDEIKRSAGGKFEDYIRRSEALREAG